MKTDKNEKNSGTAGKTEVFSAEEKAAMKERSDEMRAARKKSASSKGDGEKEVLAKISEMQEPDRIMAESIHKIVKTGAPELSPRTWYGMPAYSKDGNVVFFFQSSQKFKTRYSTLGFSDKARLDEGEMWPTSYALSKLTPKEEARIAELIRKAVG